MQEDTLISEADAVAVTSVRVDQGLTTLAEVTVPTIAKPSRRLMLLCYHVWLSKELRLGPCDMVSARTWRLSVLGGLSPSWDAGQFQRFLHRSAWQCGACFSCDAVVGGKPFVDQQNKEYVMVCERCQTPNKRRLSMFPSEMRAVCLRLDPFVTAVTAPAGARLEAKMKMTLDPVGEAVAVQPPVVTDVAQTQAHAVQTQAHAVQTHSAAVQAQADRLREFYARYAFGGAAAAPASPPKPLSLGGTGRQVVTSVVAGCWQPFWQQQQQQQQQHQPSWSFAAERKSPICHTRLWWHQMRTVANSLWNGLVTKPTPAKPTPALPMNESGPLLIGCTAQPSGDSLYCIYDYLSGSETWTNILPVQEWLNGSDVHPGLPQDGAIVGRYTAKLFECAECWSVCRHWGDDRSWYPRNFCRKTKPLHNEARSHSEPTPAPPTDVDTEETKQNSFGWYWTQLWATVGKGDARPHMNRFRDIYWRTLGECKWTERQRVYLTVNCFLVSLLPPGAQPDVSLTNHIRLTTVAAIKGKLSIPVLQLFHSFVMPSSMHRLWAVQCLVDFAVRWGAPYRRIVAAIVTIFARHGILLEQYVDEWAAWDAEHNQWREHAVRDAAAKWIKARVLLPERPLCDGFCPQLFAVRPVMLDFAARPVEAAAVSPEATAAAAATSATASAAAVTGTEATESPKIPPELNHEAEGSASAVVPAAAAPAALVTAAPVPPVPLVTTKRSHAAAFGSLHLDQKHAGPTAEFQAFGLGPPLAVADPVPALERIGDPIVGWNDAADPLARKRQRLWNDLNAQRQQLNEEEVAEVARLEAATAADPHLALTPGGTKRKKKRRSPDADPDYDSDGGNVTAPDDDSAGSEDTDPDLSPRYRAHLRQLRRRPRYDDSDGSDDQGQSPTERAQRRRRLLHSPD